MREAFVEVGETGAHHVRKSCQDFCEGVGQLGLDRVGHYVPIFACPRLRSPVDRSWHAGDLTGGCGSRKKAIASGGFENHQDRPTE